MKLGGSAKQITLFDLLYLDFIYIGCMNDFCYKTDTNLVS
jgi:hypothetical protein